MFVKNANSVSCVLFDSRSKKSLQPNETKNERNLNETFRIQRWRAINSPGSSSWANTLQNSGWIGHIQSKPTASRILIKCHCLNDVYTPVAILELCTALVPSKNKLNWLSSMCLWKVLIDYNHTLGNSFSTDWSTNAFYLWPQLHFTLLSMIYFKIICVSIRVPRCNCNVNCALRDLPRDFRCKWARIPNSNTHQFLWSLLIIFTIVDIHLPLCAILK